MNSLNKEVDNFISYLQLQRYSSNSCQSYKATLDNVIIFFKHKYPELTSLTNLTPSHLTELHRHFLKKGLKSSTIKFNISVISSFFKFCIRNNLANQNPTKNLKLHKIEERLPRFLTLGEVKKILNQPYSNHAEHTALIIINILLDTGLRISELLNAKTKNLNLETRELKVMGKGGKQRTVIFNEECRELLAKLTKGKTYILTDRRTDKPLKYGRVLRDVKRFCEKCFVYGVTPHRLRHTFASLMLQNGADLSTIMELLGHSTLSATQIYTHVDFKQMKRVMEMAHPKFRKKK